MIFIVKPFFMQENENVMTETISGQEVYEVYRRKQLFETVHAEYTVPDKYRSLISEDGDYLFLEGSFFNLNTFKLITEIDDQQEEKQGIIGSFFKPIGDKIETTFPKIVEKISKYSKSAGGLLTALMDVYLGKNIVELGTKPIIGTITFETILDTILLGGSIASLIPPIAPIAIPVNAFIVGIGSIYYGFKFWDVIRNPANYTNLKKAMIIGDALTTPAGAVPGGKSVNITYRNMVKKMFKRHGDSPKFLDNVFLWIEKNLMPYVMMGTKAIESGVNLIKKYGKFSNVLKSKNKKLAVANLFGWLVAKFVQGYPLRLVLDIGSFVSKLVKRIKTWMKMKGSTMLRPAAKVGAEELGSIITKYGDDLVKHIDDGVRNIVTKDGVERTLKKIAKKDDKYFNMVLKNGAKIKQSLEIFGRVINKNKDFYKKVSTQISDKLKYIKNEQNKLSKLITEKNRLITTIKGITNKSKKGKMGGSINDLSREIKDKTNQINKSKAYIKSKNTELTNSINSSMVDSFGESVATFNFKSSSDLIPAALSTAGHPIGLIGSLLSSLYHANPKIGIPMFAANFIAKLSNASPGVVQFLIDYYQDNWDMSMILGKNAKNLIGHWLSLTTGGSESSLVTPENIDLDPDEMSALGENPSKNQISQAKDKKFKTVLGKRICHALTKQQ